MLIAVLLLGLNIAVKGQSNGGNSTKHDENMKSELPKGLPFKPGDPGVEIVDDTWEGNAQTIRYRWQGRKFEEKRVWYKTGPREPESLKAQRRTVHTALAESGLELSEDAVSQILRAIQRANYSGVSNRIRQRPHLVGTMNYELKNAIAGAVGTSDPAVLKRVLKLDLGIELPPIPDYVVRKNLVEEVHALEDFLQAVDKLEN